jgi:hypothetical protein
MNARAIAREETDRREQMRLFESQYLQDAEVRRAARQANFSVQLESVQAADRRSVDRDFGYGIDANRYEFVITNLGPAAARSLATWLAREDANEDDTEVESLVETRPGLMPGEPWAVTLGAVPREGGMITLVLEWEDGEGPHQKRLLRRRG